MVNPTFARAIVAAAMVLTLPAFASAQQAGVKAGANFASLTPEEDEDPDDSPRLGLAAGGWVRIPAGSRLMVQFEGLFSEKGLKVNTTPFGPDTSAELRVRYIEFPVLARVDAGGSGSTRVFLIGGLAPAFMTSTRATLTFEGQRESSDQSDEVESFDAGLVGGGGVEFGRAHIDARYTYGLLPINKDRNDPNDRIQNRVFTLTFGFRLR